MIGRPVRVYRTYDSGRSFLLYRKLLVSYKAKNAPRGCASRGEEVSCKQHRSSAKESQATLMNQKERESIHYEIQQNCLIIYISQDLDHHTVNLLREQSDRLIDAGNIRHIIFDFAKTDFMDSSGIGLIMGRYKRVMFRGGKAAVTNVGNEIERIFRLSGLFKIIERYATPEQAVAGLNKRGGQDK